MYQTILSNFRSSIALFYVIVIPFFGVGCQQSDKHYMGNNVSSTENSDGDTRDGRSNNSSSGKPDPYARAAIIAGGLIAGGVAAYYLYQTNLTYTSEAKQAMQQMGISEGEVEEAINNSEYQEIIDDFSLERQAGFNMSKHARDRMNQRNISYSEIKGAVRNPDNIEDVNHSRRKKYIASKLTVIVALDKNDHPQTVITLYKNRNCY